tara:strand:- start:1284 stop:1829 length:546 start_codon:yes stop_codon:yes gene_type:complete
MSQLKVNSIIPVAGVPTGGGGGIVQIVSATKSDTSSFSASTSSPSSLESIFPITITPTNSSAKILIKFVMTVGVATSTAVTGALCRKIGGGSETILGLGDADGSRDRITQGIAVNNAHNVSTLTIEFLDSPSTTSACKYYLKLDQMSGSSLNYFIGRSSADSDSSSYARGSCQAIAMEVSA